MNGTEPRRVAAKDARRAAEAERGNVLAQQRARLGALVDEQDESGAARGRLDAERAGAGEKIEHARAGDRIAVGMEENIEQRFAQPVGGRPDRLGLRRGERAAAQASADDAHQRSRRAAAADAAPAMGAPLIACFACRRYESGGLLPDAFDEHAAAFAVGQQSGARFCGWGLARLPSSRREPGICAAVFSPDDLPRSPARNGWGSAARSFWLLLAARAL